MDSIESLSSNEVSPAGEAFDYRRIRTARRAISLASVLVYAAFLASFSLPFISASCTTGSLSGEETRVETEVMTGWQLLRRERPVGRQDQMPITRDTGGEAGRQILDAVDAASSAALGAFAIGGVMLFVALFSAVLGAPRSVAVAFLIGSAARRLEEVKKAANASSGSTLAGLPR